MRVSSKIDYSNGGFTGTGRGVRKCWWRGGGGGRRGPCEWENWGFLDFFLCYLIMGKRRCIYIIGIGGMDYYDVEEEGSDMMTERGVWGRRTSSMGRKGFLWNWDRGEGNLLREEKKREGDVVRGERERAHFLGEVTNV